MRYRTVCTVPTLTVVKWLGLLAQSAENSATVGAKPLQQQAPQNMLGDTLGADAVSLPPHSTNRLISNP